MKSYYTTSQAAKLLAVSSDTVLRWVKAGKITAYRTPGGHSRIPTDVVKALLPGAVEQPTGHIPDARIRGYGYCWTQFAGSEGIRRECLECASYRSGSRRCYEMRSQSEDFGRLGLECHTTCADCSYHCLNHTEPCKVMFLGRDTDWIADVLKEAETSGLSIEHAASEYECGALVERCRPDFIVVDRALGAHRIRIVRRLLKQDDRLPFTRIVLTSNRPAWADDCAGDVCGWIRKPFTSSLLKDFIAGIGRLDQRRDSLA